MAEATRELVDESWCRLLPKIELHAHLSGSISKTTLHKIWARKRRIRLCSDLEDPRLALADMPDIHTFFGVFHNYIYKLVNDRESITEAVHGVLDDFQRDGVVYIELRTTPRAIPDTEILPTDYVEIVLGAMRDRAGQQIVANLILSVDRSMTAQQAREVLEIAHTYRKHQDNAEIPSVVAIDLCGNPTKGDVSTFSEVFQTAKRFGIQRVVHFAEVPESSTDKELETILSWEPRRLGHVIHVSDTFKNVIKQQGIALELCLSCNMIAKMITGGIAEHHFGFWKDQQNDIALSTDDVGVFESVLSNEVYQAAKHFKLSKTDCISLQKSAARAACRYNDSLADILEEFRLTQSSIENGL